MSFLSGEAFYFYFSKFVSDGSTSNDGNDYDTVRCILVEGFRKKRSLEGMICSDMSANLDNTYFISSLENIEELYKQSGFNEEAKFWLFQNSL